MSVNEQRLLDSWASERDAEAFKAIANRYAGLVYATCRRILGNDTDAEDVAQECFVALAGAGRKPGDFLGAWLHRVATNKSLTRIRGERNRRNREEVWQQTGTDPVAAAEHRDLCAVVDEAIARLPDDLRVPLVAHFIEDRTHDAIAADLGVSRQTVTYRIGKGIERIRKRLQVNAIAFSAASLADLLKPASMAPASLLAEVGKLAAAGPVAPAASVTAFTVAKVAALALAVICVGGLVTVHYINAHNRAKTDAAWRELMPPGAPTSTRAKPATSPAQPVAATQEPDTSAGAQTPDSSNAALASASSATVATNVPVSPDSFQPYSFLREVFVNGESRGSARFFALTRTLWRTEDSDGDVGVGDLDARIDMCLSPADKTVVKSTWPDDPSVTNTNAADKVEEWRKQANGSIESLETTQIEGKECRGLHSVNEYEENTIWVDSQTNLPVRIESHSLTEDFRSVESQFRYGVDTDPALRTIAVPEGYAVKEETRHRPLSWRWHMFWDGVWSAI